MVFSSTIFLLYFLPVVLLLYFLAGKKYKNLVLLAASFFFYAWGEPKFVMILIVSVFVNYSAGMCIQLSGNKTWSNLILSLAVSLNLGILFFYKYIDFTIDILNKGIMAPLNLGMFNRLELALPIGLSFFTFQGLSYVVDVYRGTVPAQKNPFHIALYISMFPQLVAGPIVRYEDIYKNMVHRMTTLQDAFEGTQRFIIGLSKKVMIADVMALSADKIFTLPLEELQPSVAWLGAVCYTFQIYFDFSGYSDMAIGLGRIFGFRFPENFNLPYISKSVTEFWRRWHISLSTWFRDYLYIPLGGNRKGNVYLHLLIVFFCTGLWHGAAFTFIVWGGVHGVFLIIERVLKLKGCKLHIPNVLQWLYTMAVVVVGWVIFRSDSLAGAFGFLKAMAGAKPAGFPYFGLRYYIDRQVVLTLSAAVIISSGCFGRFMRFSDTAGSKMFCFRAKILALWFLLFCCICMIVNGNYSPFIYFRF